MDRHTLDGTDTAALNLFLHLPPMATGILCIIE